MYGYDAKSGAHTENNYCGIRFMRRWSHIYIEQGFLLYAQVAVNEVLLSQI